MLSHSKKQLEKNYLKELEIYIKGQIMSNKSLIQSDLLDMNVTWLLKDLKFYDNQCGLLESLIFTAAQLMIFVMAVIVHRAFYKLMQRLPGRAINQMIYPYMVSITIQNYQHIPPCITTVTILEQLLLALMVPIYQIGMDRPYLKQNIFFFQISVSSFMVPYLLYFTLVCWVYPMKRYIGEIGCNIIMFLSFSGSLAIQLQSFVMAIFRYICLFHDNILLKFNLSPNVCNSFITYIQSKNFA